VIKTLGAGAVGVMARFLPPLGGYQPVAEADACAPPAGCWIVGTDSWCGPNPQADQSLVQCCNGYGDFPGAITVIDVIECYFGNGYTFYSCAGCCIGYCYPCTNWNVYPPYSCP
jgi:hypothetical protein